MPGCAVYGCGNYSRTTKDSTIRYYSFPKNPDLRKQWVISCYRKDKFNIDQARICSIHFQPTSFHVSMKHRLMNYKPKTCRDLKEDAIPTEHLYKKSVKISTKTDVERKKRIERKRRKEIVSEILHEESSSSSPFEDEIMIEDEDTHLSNNSETPVKELHNLIEQLRLENRTLKIEKEELETSLQSTKSELQETMEILKQYFGPGQIKKMFNPGKTIRWTPHDIASAIMSAQRHTGT